MDKEILLTPNSFARGGYPIGEKENNLFLKIMYMIQKENRNYIITKKISDTLSQDDITKWEELCKIETLQCSISKSDLLSLFKNRNDRTPEGVDLIFKALKDCEIRFKTITRDKKSATMVASLLSHYYIEDSGDYTIVVPAKLYKYLFDLGLGHTQNALQVIYSLGGLYSRRLYLILRSWTGSKRHIEFTVKDLRYMLQCENSNKTFNQFETNVLKRAVDEINKSKVMYVTIKDKIKKGRSMHSIIFAVSDMEPRNYLESPIYTEISCDKEPIYLIDGVLVECENVLTAVKVLLGEVNYDSPFVKQILIKAYAKTIAKDKNKDTMLTKQNMNLFITIAEGEFLTHNLGSRF